MAVNQLLVKSYAGNIYLSGKRTFETIGAEYHEPVKQYAAGNYSKDIIDNAFAKGWINQLQYDETLAYKYPDGNIPMDMPALNEEAAE